MTLTQFQQNHAVELEAKWNEKYPLGRFVIQMRRIGPMGVGRIDFRAAPLPKDLSNPNQKIEINLALERRRRTSYAAYSAIVVSNDPRHPRPTSLNNTWGFVRSYSTLEALVKAAKKYNIPENQIEAFQQLLKTNGNKEEK